MESFWTAINPTPPSPPVLKIEFGPPHSDLGSVWSPQKAHKFGHKQQTKMDILWQCQFDTVCFPVQIQFCCPLWGSYNWIVLSPTLLGHLDTLVPSALKANKFSGPPALWSPQTCFGPPHMCAVCVDFKDRGLLYWYLVVMMMVMVLPWNVDQAC